MLTGKHDASNPNHALNNMQTRAGMTPRSTNVLLNAVPEEQES